MLGFQGGVSIPLVKGGVKAPPAKRQCRAGPKAGARRGLTRKNAHSTELRGEVCHRSAKASGGEDLQVEKPVSCWDCASFYLHATVAGMLGPTLIRDEVV